MAKKIETNKFVIDQDNANGIAKGGFKFIFSSRKDIRGTK